MSFDRPKLYHYGCVTLTPRLNIRLTCSSLRCQKPIRTSLDIVLITLKQIRKFKVQKKEIRVEKATSRHLLLIGRNKTPRRGVSHLGAFLIWHPDGPSRRGDDRLYASLSKRGTSGHRGASESLSFCKREQQVGKRTFRLIFPRLPWKAVRLNSLSVSP